MGDKTHSKNGAVVVTELPSDEELEEQLRESKRRQHEAHQVIERADETASEMAKVLRRLAAAIDRNPQSWDSLFQGKGR